MDNSRQKLDLRGVFAVPSMARKQNARPAPQSGYGAPGRRPLDLAESERLVRHIAQGGISRFIYGGNAFLYHLTLAEYEELLDWLGGFPEELCLIPSAGPSYGRAMDQAPLLRKHIFPCVMMLPCNDPRDAAGLELGLREFANAAGTPLILYLKDESNFGADKKAGLDAVARLVNDGICVAIKYAIVRANPEKDDYLAALLDRVDRNIVLSGMGERPAICHLREWKLPGFTTGSGCVAPRLSNALFEACARGDFAAAERLRSEFLPLEDLRDAWGPARVLHSAVEFAGIATTGPLTPYLSSLTLAQLQELAPVARSLAERNS
ncbi:MAG: dihydrodipicolinate synthase family protein [Acidobacteria bacterium]|nr:dihydrodipicolinate synthase family protein [Acidobacteriota bacterium]